MGLSLLVSGGRNVPPGLKFEVDRGRVDLEPQTEGCRSIGEHMTEMGFTVGAGYTLDWVSVFEGGVNMGVVYFRHV